MVVPFNILVLSYLVVFYSCYAVGDKNENNPEKLSLLYFKGSLKNSHFLSSWHSVTLHCNWVGVTCQLRRVTSLSLHSRYLKGNLSLSLTSLSFLTILNLEDNQFSSEIPGEVGRLLNLKTLRLSSNSFSGELPSEIGNWKNLTALCIGINKLSGALPKEAWNAPF